jgi:hypothetical protein
MQLTSLSLALSRLQGSGSIATLNLNFVGATALDPRVTFTRASTATFFDSAGVLTSAAVDAPRFDYNPSTLAAQGLLIEESRTNSIRNNTMVGAVAGTPGTLPTNWSGAATISGLARTIVGVGTENGISYIDVNYAGTTTAALSNSSIISTEPANQITAASGQIWTHSVYLKLQGGSFPAATTVNVRISETDGTTNLANSTTPTVPTSAALNSQRYALTRTLTNALTTFVQPVISLTAPNSTAIDFTLRIGLPQLELGAFATSVIPTTTTALTRAVDLASVNTLSPWYNATEGTVYAEGLFIDVGAGTAGVVSSGASARYAYRSSSGVLRAFDGTTITTTANSTSVNSVFKVATGYTQNTSLSICLNAGTVATAGTLAAAFTSGTSLVLGNVAASNPMNGYLRRVVFYPRRLSNAELQDITT